MSKVSKVVLILIVLLLVPLVAAASSHPTDPAEKVFQAATSLACGEKGLQCSVLGVSRDDLGHDLVRYRALIKVDAGDFDVIALNRVIHEPRVGHSIQTVGSFFFIPGSDEDFRSALVAPHGDSGLAVFLGKHNIDVWGIDLRNVQIPSDVTALPNAHDWGFDLQIKDIRLATRIARYVRAMTGQRIGRIILSGHSAGAALTYAVANAEAAIPRVYRDIGGMIPIDMVYKLPASETDKIQLACNVAGYYKFANDSGVYFFDSLALIAAFTLAQTDPKGTSPYGPPLTNLQYALEFAGKLLAWPFYPIHPWAIVRDDTGIAKDGRYTTVDDILENMVLAPPYPVPNAMTADMWGTTCASTATPYDDNLAKVKVPVLYIGAAGGFGTWGEYTPQLLGSRDVTAITIQLRPDDDAGNDFGHMEAFTASQAQDLVWKPVLKWIVEHQAHHHGR